ncbi:c-type cytochrome [Sulfurimonas sp. SAG-AH-194-L11]|nr:c-type cytochrome [Sulfurimonas sp. SAG-AH-194-L11]MDF1876314.1 c-type cytochrome [Sulfurimonas sp. SAG-AH-194-L11]
MKKLFLVIALGVSSLMASTGAEVYKAKCQMCHAPKGMMDKEQMQSMRAKMQNATKEEKMAMREKMAEKMKKSGMRAPAMPMISARLKSNLKTRDEFITFVEDYIQNPSKKKGFCMPMAYKKFGTMPPIGKGMNKADRASVAAWLYDNYKATGMCEMKGKMQGMKCGSGKCGASDKTEKSSSKCGAVSIPTH